jgi:hypothetical protein
MSFTMKRDMTKKDFKFMASQLENDREGHDTDLKEMEAEIEMLITQNEKLKKRTLDLECEHRI